MGFHYIGLYLRNEMRISNLKKYSGLEECHASQHDRQKSDYYRSLILKQRLDSVLNGRKAQKRFWLGANVRKLFKKNVRVTFYRYLVSIK